MQLKMEETGGSSLASSSEQCVVCHCNPVSSKTSPPLETKEEEEDPEVVCLTPSSTENKKALKDIAKSFNQLGIEVEGENQEFKELVCQTCLEGAEEVAKWEVGIRLETERKRRLEQELKETGKRLGVLKGRIGTSLKKIKISNKKEGEGGKALIIREGLAKYAENWRNAGNPGVLFNSPKTKSLSASAPSTPVRAQGAQRQSARQQELRLKTEQSPKHSGPGIRSTRRTAAKSKPATRTFDDKLDEGKMRAVVLVKKLTPELILEKQEKLKQNQAKVKKEVSMKVVYFGDTTDEDESSSSNDPIEMDEYSVYSSDNSAASFVVNIRRKSGLPLWCQKVVAALYGKQEFEEKMAGAKGKWGLEFENRSKKLTYGGIPIVLCPKEECLKCGRCRGPNRFVTDRHPESYWPEITGHIKSVHLEKGTVSSGGSSLEGNQGGKDSWDEADWDSEPNKEEVSPREKRRTARRQQNENGAVANGRPQRKRRAPERFQEVDSSDEEEEKERSGAEEWSEENKGSRAPAKKRKKIIRGGVLQETVSRVEPELTSAQLVKRVMEDLQNWDGSKEGKVALSLLNQSGAVARRKLIVCNPQTSEVQVAGDFPLGIGNEGKTISCGVCKEEKPGKEFRELILHVLRAHTKAFSCQECRLNFTTPFEAEAHMIKCNVGEKTGEGEEKEGPENKTEGVGTGKKISLGQRKNREEEEEDEGDTSSTEEEPGLLDV